MAAADSTKGKQTFDENYQRCANVRSKYNEIRITLDAEPCTEEKINR